MPRPRRVFVPGGVFHIYARTARGEVIFSDEEEAQAFVDILREIKSRDSFSVFAWALMGNHYHIAMRVGQTAL